MKTLWGYLTARYRPSVYRLIIRVFHPDAFSRELTADELPGSITCATSCSIDEKNDSLAVLEVILIGNTSNSVAASMLHRLANALGQSPESVAGKRYSVSQGTFVYDEPPFPKKRRKP